MKETPPGVVFISEARSKYRPTDSALPIRSQTTGREFESATIILSIREYLDPNVQEWIAYAVLTRMTRPADITIRIEA